MGSFRPPAVALLLAALLCGAQPPSADAGASADAKDASSDEEGRGSSQQTLSSSETNRFCRLANASGCWGRHRAYGDDALLTFADLNVTATYEPTRMCGVGAEPVPSHDATTISGSVARTPKSPTGSQSSAVPGCSWRFR